MSEPEDEDVILKFVHTADWHLGRRFPAFSEADRIKLTRARLDGIDKILGEAKQRSVHAILCAGDLFDEPDPGSEWWEPLADKFKKQGPGIPIFLLPGNHDPLEAGSVYQSHHPFRHRLPPWVHVVDSDSFVFELTPEAVLYAAPCRSRAGQEDPTLLLPLRDPGDERIRIGMVHGSTFDIEGYQSNFPIASEAAARRGLDYLAIGDHHGYREVPPLGGPRTIYPGTHEPMSFSDSEGGAISVVSIDKHRKSHPQRKPISKWTWEDIICRSLDELKDLRDSKDRKTHVLRLKLEIKAPAPDYEVIEKILRELQGNDAVIGRVGILQLDRSKLKLDTSDIQTIFEGLPQILQACAARLKALEQGDQAEVAQQALLHLYRCATEKK